MPKPPTSEKGAPAAVLPSNLLPWAAYIEDRDYAPDVMWPQSVETYTRIQTDAQVKGLLLATTLPIRRFLWEIDPNGAKPEVVEHVASSLNLPIRGQDPPPIRRRNRFSWPKHLAHALRCLAYGHYYFEQVYDYSDPRKGGDGRFRLRKLGTRPPRTIVNILQDPDGGLRAIEQATGINASSGLTASLEGVRLDVSRLLAYVWDSEDDGDWVGRSMLRPCFRNWLIKDRLLRVDATKHERNAMGIPWFQVDPNASAPQIENLAEVAKKMRAGEESGGAGPGKLELKGVDGNLPDTIGSVRYHDQQMSRAFLLLFFELGTSETGSRALGGELIDWYPQGQDAIADHIRDTFQEHQIEDEVEINWGPEEQPPALVYTRLEGTEPSIEDLALAVEKGLIAVDEELHSYIVRKLKLPSGTALPEPATESGQPQGQKQGSKSNGQEPSPGASTAVNGDQGQAQTPLESQNLRAPAQPKRSALATRIAETVDRPMSWPDVARAVGSDPKNGTARRARDELVAAGAILKDRRNGTLMPVSGISLPDRDLRRQPYDFEVAAAVDFAAMEETYETRRASLVEAVKAAQGAQIDELATAVEESQGNAAKLAQLTVKAIDVDLIRSHLAETAREGEASAKDERDAQVGLAAKNGVGLRAILRNPNPSFAAADQDRIDETLDERSEAVALTLAGGLAAAASKRAASVSTLPPAEAAANVREYLGGLSDAELNRQLGGATTQAFNAGRREYMRANDPKAVYASELLDSNTCTECKGVDGREYPSIEASEGDYPIGGFVYCEGGLLCRGTIVAVY